MVIIDHPKYGPYWLVQYERQPTPDFITGNSGVIRFLLRYCYPDEMEIRVTCVDGITGTTIGKYKIGLTQLPPSFNKPVSMVIEGKEWRVIKANPPGADDIAIFRTMTNLPGLPLPWIC